MVPGDFDSINTSTNDSHSRFNKSVGRCLFQFNVHGDVNIYTTDIPYILYRVHAIRFRLEFVTKRGQFQKKMVGYFRVGYSFY